MKSHRQHARSVTTGASRARIAGTSAATADSKLRDGATVKENR
ncbi:MAG: hypothetical protein ABJE66_18215 [Deltaproteobacteria bacterium]